jgi:hypothetical protein
VPDTGDEDVEWFGGYADGAMADKLIEKIDGFTGDGVGRFHDAG